MNVNKDNLLKEIFNKIYETLSQLGIDDDAIAAYTDVDIYDNDGRVVVEVRGEWDFDEMDKLADALNPIIQQYDDGAYFDHDAPGIISAYLADNSIKLGERLGEYDKKLFDELDECMDLEALYALNAKNIKKEQREKIAEILDRPEISVENAKEIIANIQAPVTEEIELVDYTPDVNMDFTNGCCIADVPTKFNIGDTLVCDSDLCLADGITIPAGKTFVLIDTCGACDCPEIEFDNDFYNLIHNGENAPMIALVMDLAGLMDNEDANPYLPNIKFETVHESLNEDLKKKKEDKVTAKSLRESLKKRDTEDFVNTDNSYELELMYESLKNDLSQDNLEAINDFAFNKKNNSKDVLKFLSEGLYKDYKVAKKSRLNESVNVQKKKTLKESKQLNEGAGSGYEVRGEGNIEKISNIVITDIDTHYELQPTVRFTADIKGNVNFIHCESYEYGGEIKNINTPMVAHSGEITIDINDGDSIEEETINELEYLARVNADFEFSVMYGGGWTHSTYDGTIATEKEEIEVESGSYTSMVLFDGTLTDNEIINCIDEMVSGPNEVFITSNNELGRLEDFDNLEDAIKEAENDPQVDEIIHDYVYRTGLENWEYSDGAAEVVWTREKNESLKEDVDTIITYDITLDGDELTRPRDIKDCLASDNIEVIEIDYGPFDEEVNTFVVDMTNDENITPERITECLHSNSINVVNVEKNNSLREDVEVSREEIEANLTPEQIETLDTNLDSFFSYLMRDKNGKLYFEDDYDRYEYDSFEELAKDLDYTKEQWDKMDESFDEGSLVKEINKLIYESGFELDRSVPHKNPVKSMWGNSIHWQVVNRNNVIMADEDDEDSARAQLREIAEPLIYALDKYDEEHKDCSITWNFGANDNMEVTAGFDVRWLEPKDESLNEEVDNAAYNLAAEIEEYVTEKDSSLWVDLAKYEEVNPGAFIIEFDVDGDWKHTHLRFDNLVSEFLGSAGYRLSGIDEEEVGDSGSDSYESIHRFFIVKQDRELDEDFWNHTKWFDRYCEFEDYSAEAWNSWDRETRNSVVEEQVDDFLSTFLDEITADDIKELLDDMTDNNYHTDARILRKKAAELFPKEF